MNKLLTVLLVLTFSCNNTTKPKTFFSNSDNMKDVYYEDIDFYNLKGLKPLQEITYPCIQIKDSGSQKVVIFYISKDDNFSKEYFRKDSMWVGHFDFKADTSMIYSYEFILKNRFITFNYLDTNSYLLKDASIVSNSAMTIWVPNKGMQIRPNPDNLDIVIKNSKSKFIEEIIIKDSTLIKTGKEVNMNGEARLRYATCFAANSRTIFWWLYLGHTQQGVDCREKYTQYMKKDTGSN